MQHTWHGIEAQGELYYGDDKNKDKHLGTSVLLLHPVLPNYHALHPSEQSPRALDLMFRQTVYLDDCCPVE